MSGELIKQEQVVDKSTGEIIPMPSNGIEITSVNELGVASTVASAQQEVQAAIFLAKKFPRDPRAAWSSMMKACQRPNFAKRVRWTKPQGGSPISGPSVHLAREAARCWGNIRFGFDIIYDSEEDRVIRCWAWDMETNTKPFQDMLIKRRIQYKDKQTQKTMYRTATDLDMLSLTNSQAARGVRNCLFNLLPVDLIEDSVEAALKTMRSNTGDPDKEKKSLIFRYSKLGVTIEMLDRCVGTSSWSPEHIITLTELLQAIKEGEAKVDEVFLQPNDGPAKSTISEDDMKPADSAKHQDVATGQTKTEKPAPATGADGDEF